MERCQNCPCPTGCQALPVFCEWMAAAVPDPVHVAHIKHKGGCLDPADTGRYSPRPDPRPRGLRKEVVIARYREDLAWVEGVPDDYHVSLYDKGNQPIDVGRQVRLERLPNVGREAHTIAYHCWRYYEDLADLTVFAQGDATFHAPDFIGRLGVEYDRLTSLTETYSPTHPPEWIHEYDRVEYVGGYRVALGDATIEAHNGHPQSKPWWNPAVWPYVFACPQPKPLYFCYGAQMAVPRGDIRARPK